MITGITIENFKGIRERVDVELRPLTLLFGANSAGKSTIVDALAVLEEVLLERHHRRGKSISRRFIQGIGSIRELVHGQESERKITLGVTVPLGGSDDDDIFSWYRVASSVHGGTSIKQAQMPKVYYLRGLGGNDATSVTLAITFGEPQRLTMFENSLVPLMEIDQLVISVNGLELVRLKSSGEQGFDFADKTEVEFIDWEVNTDHPVLSEEINRQGTLRFRRGMQHILPIDYPPPLDDSVRELKDGSLALSLNVAMLAILHRIETELACHRRLGPMRMVPSRHFRPQPQPSREDWLTGIGAWDHLGFATEASLKSINEWLGPEQLDTGISVLRQYMISIEEAAQFSGDPKNKLSFTPNDLLGRYPRDILVVPIGTKYGGAFQSTHTLLPSQVGTGISQIVPVVVACVIRGGQLLSIAQPELHLHPRLQVKLGDLFIDFINNSDGDEPPSQLIVETHSEHLILRLLRRVRETSKQCAPSGLELTSDDIVVYHVAQEQGISVIRKLDVDAGGQFVQPWPDDFFEIDFYERFQTGSGDAN